MTISSESRLQGVEAIIQWQQRVPPEPVDVRHAARRGDAPICRVKAVAEGSWRGGEDFETAPEFELSSPLLVANAL